MDFPAGEQVWRAALSALLDGEEPQVPLAGIAAHLDDCDDCSVWLDRATTVNSGLRMLPLLQADLGERVVNVVDVRLCGCRTGDPCLCSDCQCGPHCTCHRT
ncbi:zf-HC2 domain-containing protein [Propionicicella superfundia]|uniref:zf-HC2 domain-containing protein n=1 Tax=Propionicicella superfundia TaxID=348582 RepID=UPI000412B92A|nr:zf-HC2 domain-containing protein [Propionicicella superfundia]